jgi:hypothetical protein
MILIQMPAKNIKRIGWGFLGRVMQMHMDFFRFAPAFTMIAMWTSRHHIRPNMFAAHMPWDHVIDR